MGAFFSSMTVVDVVLLVFALFGLIRGFVCGFSKECGKFLVLVLSIATGLITYEKVARMIYDSTMVKPEIVSATVLFGIFFLSSFVYKFILHILSKIVSFQFVYIIERFIGGIIGAVRYTLLFCFLSYLLLMLPTTTIQPYYDNAHYSGAFVQQAIPFVKGYTDVLRDAWHLGEPEQENAAPAQQPAAS